ncbi:MAG: hypothetical protein ACREBC_37035, partial [Pyrinomonadaceae bacterium]
PEFRVRIGITQVSNAIRKRIRPDMSATAWIQTAASKPKCKHQPAAAITQRAAGSEDQNVERSACRPGLPRLARQDGGKQGDLRQPFHRHQSHSSPVAFAFTKLIPYHSRHAKTIWNKGRSREQVANA